MDRVDVRIQAKATLANAARVIEALCAREGLSLKLKGSLSTHPTSVHWHFRRGRESGTLEITWWRSAGRIWFSTHRGREAAWIQASVRRLRAALERRFG